MLTMINDGITMENIVAIPGRLRFRKQRKATALYLCCDLCGNPMVNSYVCVWTEDRFGRPHNVTLLHYKCQAPFEAENKGTWLSRGMPARSLQR